MSEETLSTNLVCLPKAGIAEKSRLNAANRLKHGFPTSDADKGNQNQRYSIEEYALITNRFDVFVKRLKLEAKPFGSKEDAEDVLDFNKICRDGNIRPFDLIVAPFDPGK